MGCRTIVILNDDTDWVNDPHLGKKIAEVGYRRNGFFYGTAGSKGGGYVLSSGQHYSIDEIIHVRHLAADVIAHRHYSGVEKGDAENDRLALLKEAADTLGYRLVRKNVKKGSL